jgi:hypothetical protein
VSPFKCDDDNRSNEMNTLFLVSSVIDRKQMQAKDKYRCRAWSRGKRKVFAVYPKWPCPHLPYRISTEDLPCPYQHKNWHAGRRHCCVCAVLIVCVFPGRVCKYVCMCAQCAGLRTLLLTMMCEGIDLQFH